MRNRYLLELAFAVAIVGCSNEDSAGAAAADPGSADPGSEVTGVALSDWDARLAAEEIEAGRLDPAWRQVVQFDTVSVVADSVALEAFDSISAESVNTRPMSLPLYGDVGGPSVLRVQILLDRALFSPGIIDGHWGKNTEKAVYWLQHREGLPRTGRVDQRTFERLAQLAGGSNELIRPHTLTAEDVEGPFVSIPEDIYEKAGLDCMCYESLSEKLAERFHTSRDVLAKLNPGVELDAVAAGDQLQVPVVRSDEAGRGLQVARLVVSDQGFYVHALDANDRILFHFPSTLGSSFDPSPTGNHSVARITHEPWWHYQPAILEHVDDDEEEAKIPPGPNNAVGPVWMALSIPHYGIHGTSAPETIGYTTSAGCVRLTNWDALFLADRIEEGVAVDFTESPEETAPDPSQVSPAGEGS
jgi:lipoprotein-anchoring transpeptidase ErfK/SrfK